MKTFHKKRKIGLTNELLKSNSSNSQMKKKKQNQKSFGSQKKKRNRPDDANQKKRFKFDNQDDESHNDPNEPDWQENVSKHLLVKPGVKWFEQVKALEVESKSPVNPRLAASLMKEAEDIIKEDGMMYKKFLEKRKEKSDFAWIRTVIRTGTMSDKISAHTLLIQDCPVHNTNSLKSLIAMVNIKGKRECLMAMDCLRDLFLSDLLPDDKKLKSFNEHSLDKLNEITKSNPVTRKKVLLLWLFEDHLKNLYSSFTKNLEAVSHDTIEKIKQKTVTVMSQLLKDSPEQEQFLLESLVNKIGDPVAKVGSHVCHLLGQLVCRHKMMIVNVVQEVERLLFRTNVPERAQYYCLCFYNQLLFDKEQANIPNHLITIYFGLFKMCVRKGEVNSKMMSALLTGVSRAYPYTKLKNNVMMEQLDAMFRLVHMVSFNISVQALMLIFQVLDAKDSLSDRFYSALYRKLLDPALSSSTRQSMLLNLTFKALKKDTARVRVKAFTKRLIQVALHQSPNFQCGILMLVSNLLSTHPEILETTMVTFDSDSESDEHFEDITESEGEGNVNSDQPAGSKTSKVVSVPKVTSSWVHRENKDRRSKTKYDPQNRNPLHCGAEFSNLWELQLLKKSFHPSVSLFAQNVFDGEEIKYGGDPLKDFSLIRFLDRFVFRNPKKPPQSVTANAHRRVFGKQYTLNHESQAPPICSDSYTKQKEEKIPVEERFIYRYLKQRVTDDKKPRSRGDSDVESVGDDEFDNLLNQIHPDGEGDDELNFAKELSVNKLQKKNKRTADESGSENEDFSDFEEESLDFENDPEFQNAFGDLDDMEEEDAGNEADTNEDFIDKGTVVKSKKMLKKKQRKTAEVFTSADDFDEMLEENSGKGVDSSTTNAFVNYDNAAAKQLAWEKQREQFMKGRDWRSKKMNYRKKFPRSSRGRKSKK